MAIRLPEGYMNGRSQTENRPLEYPNYIAAQKSREFVQDYPRLTLGARKNAARGAQ
jgi:hypothetical protein